MTERLFTLIKLRNAARRVHADEQNLPSIPEGFDDKGIVGASAPRRTCGHAAMVQEKLNECKR